MLLFTVELPAKPVYVPDSSSIVCQLTGDKDSRLHKPTLSQTAGTAGITGTDLGSSFEHKGRLYFLFGDTVGRKGKDADDAFAYSTSRQADKLLLKFPLAPDGKFQPIIIPNVPQGYLRVPSYGISIDGKIYIVHTTDWYHPKNKIDPRGNMERSVLARSDDDGYTWQYIYDLSAALDHDMTNARFINVSLAMVPAEEFDGRLAYYSSDVVLIWGSGAYRKSNPALACIPADRIEDKSFLRYFNGLDENGRPKWSDKEAEAKYLFEHPTMGEFSVAWIEQIKRWVMLYNSGGTVCLRTAQNPWGPFSECNTVIDFEFRKKNKWAAAYGPYIIPRFTKGNEKLCRIYYTISSWRPYQVQLVTSVLEDNDITSLDTNISNKPQNNCLQKAP